MTKMESHISDTQLTDLTNNQSEYDMSDMSFDEENLRNLEEYWSIVKLYRDLPKDMCIVEIARVYAYSDADLERVRENYFVHLKESCLNFPFDENSSLKRRVFTRNGDPLSIRLARDIYCLVEVAEGGDPLALKPLISTSKSKRRRKSSVNQIRLNSETRNSTCTCSSEIILIKDQVACLQANILLMKQMFQASNVLQKDHISDSKLTLQNIRSDLNQCSEDSRECLSKTISTVRDVVSSAMGRITEFEDRLRLLEVFIDDNNLVSVTNAKYNEMFPESEHLSSRENNHEHVINEFGKELDIDSDGLLIDCESSGNQSCEDNSNEQCNSVIRTPNENVIAFTHCNSIEVSDSNSIPVRITKREEHSQTHDGFEVFTRKKPRHFCILGLSKNLNPDVLASVVAQKGPEVTNVAVFPMRTNPNKVVVKLSIKNNDQTEIVMNNRFWPSYVSCRPWRSRSSQHRFIPPRIQRSETHTLNMKRTKTNSYQAERMHSRRYNGDLSTSINSGSDYKTRDICDNLDRVPRSYDSDRTSRQRLTEERYTNNCYLFNRYDALSCVD